MVVADVFSGVLVVVFGGASFGKFLRQRQQVLTAEKLRIRWRRYRLIGVPEVLACIGLLLGFSIAPLGAAAALGLVILMAGALAFRLRVHDAVGFLVGDATILALAAATVALRLG